MNDSKIVRIFGALLCIVSGVMAHELGGSYECKPAYTWTEGDNVTIELRIDRSKYPSECAGTPTGIAFFQSSPDGTTAYSTICPLTDDIQTSCSFTSGTPGCGCTNSDDNGYYVIEYNFVATAGLDRWWKADIICETPPPDLDKALYFEANGCFRGVDIVPQTTTAPTTTAPEPEKDCVEITVTCRIIIGCETGAVFVTIVIIVVLKWRGIIVLEIKCGERDSKDKAGQPGDGANAGSHRPTPSTVQPDPEAVPLGLGPSPQKGQPPRNHESGRDSKENQDGEPGNKTGSDASGKKRKQPKDDIQLSTLRSNSRSPDQPSEGRELPVPRNNTAAGSGVSTTITVRNNGSGEPAQLNPAEGQSNTSMSKPPRLAPLGSASKTIVTSVERNSIGKARELPLPSIHSTKEHNEN